MPSTNVVGATQTASATGYFVGENKPKPLSALAFAALSLTPRKIAADIAATDELLRVANADAALLMERSAGKANAVTWDTALLDPANAGIANIKPASLLNGLVALTPSGDYANQVGQVFAAISDGAPANPVLILSLQSALRLMALRDLASIGVKVIVSPARRTASSRWMRTASVTPTTEATSELGNPTWRCQTRRPIRLSPAPY